MSPCAGQPVGLVPPAEQGGLEAGRQQLQHMLQVGDGRRKDLRMILVAGWK
jgi:hypothetical protein